jgi:hypothetical protein
VIVVPSNEGELQWCKDFYAAHNMQMTEGAQWLIWTISGVPQWVIAFDVWVGHTCQVHMVARRRGSPPPRQLIRATFRHAFNVLKRTHLFAMVQSKDKHVLRLDKWYGFREVYRAVGAGSPGDIVLLEMTPADCRWLKD